MFNVCTLFTLSVLFLSLSFFLSLPAFFTWVSLLSGLKVVQRVASICTLSAFIFISLCFEDLFYNFSCCPHHSIFYFYLFIRFFICFIFCFLGWFASSIVCVLRSFIMKPREREWKEKRKKWNKRRKRIIVRALYSFLFSFTSHLTLWKLNYFRGTNLNLLLFHRETHPDSMGKKDVIDVVYQLKNAAVKFGMIPFHSRN